MGQEITSTHFTGHDFRVFERRLRDETRLLTEWYESTRLDDGPSMGGFEVEAWLVNRKLEPFPINQDYIERLGDSLVVPELAKFNVELNTEPVCLRDQALRRMERQLQETWDRCKQVADEFNARLAMIGILPTVREGQLSLINMTPLHRYRALNEQVLKHRRGRALELDIRGRETLRTSHRDVMLESATTSFQIHLQVAPRDARRFYNASIVLSAPMVAMSANSPYLFGRDLWDETRVPLFEQSVDVTARVGGSCDHPELHRVTFGSGYVRESMMECFHENEHCFHALLPMEMDKYPSSLSHLRLHNGTIWRWNRPLVGFDRNGCPHLRIEHRVMPAGPSVLDSIANAAFYFGLVHSLGREDEPPEERLSFEDARENFYRASRRGLDSEIVWLEGRRVAMRELLLDELLPRAAHGLGMLDIDGDDIQRYLGVVERRVKYGINGTVWQRAFIEQNGPGMDALVAAYLRYQESGLPVVRWPV